MGARESTFNILQVQIMSGAHIASSSVAFIGFHRFFYSAARRKAAALFLFCSRLMMLMWLRKNMGFPLHIVERLYRGSRQKYTVCSVHFSSVLLYTIRMRTDL